MADTDTTHPARCDFCGRAPHAGADHPLPKDHPDYDAFFDASDSELAPMVSASLPPLTGDVSR